MPDYNYSNPSGMAPSIGWKPEGFLAGGMYQDQEADYRRAMELSNVLQNLGVRQKGAEVQNYLADQSLRDAQRGLGVAKATAETPIQGDLAAAQAAEARAKSTVAPSNAETTVYENRAKRQAHAEELVSNYLNANLEQNKDNPTAAMLAWRDQIVPQLERQTGEPLPPEFRTMGYQQMLMVSDALTRNAATRRAMLQQGQKDTAHMARTQAEVAGRLGVAEVKTGQETSAELRSRAYQQHISARTEDLFKQIEARNRAAGKKDTRVTEEEMGQVQRRAVLEANQLFFGGNPYQRADAAVAAAEGKGENSRIEFEKRTAVLLPTNPKDRESGVLYKSGSGKFARWDGIGLIPVE